MLFSFRHPHLNTLSLLESNAVIPPRAWHSFNLKDQFQYRDTNDVLEVEADIVKFLVVRHNLKRFRKSFYILIKVFVSLPNAPLSPAPSKMVSI